MQDPHFTFILIRVKVGGHLWTQGMNPSYAKIYNLIIHLQLMSEALRKTCKKRAPSDQDLTKPMRTFACSPLANILPASFLKMNLQEHARSWNGLIETGLRNLNQDSPSSQVTYNRRTCKTAQRRGWDPQKWGFCLIMNARRLMGWEQFCMFSHTKVTRDKTIGLV